MNDINSEILDELNEREYEHEKSEADSRFKIGDFSTSLEHYFKCLSHREEIYTLEQIARCYHELNDSASEIKFWKRVLEKNSFHIKARLEVSKARFSSVVQETRQKVMTFQGDYESALLELEKNRNEISKFQYHQQRSEYLFKLERWEDCLKENEILNNFEPGPKILEMILLCLFRVERFEEVVDYKNTHPLKSATPEVLKLIADSCLLCKKDEEALQYYSEAFMMKPEEELIMTILDIESKLNNGFRILREITASETFCQLDRHLLENILTRLFKYREFVFEPELINNLSETVRRESILYHLLFRIAGLSDVTKVNPFFNHLDADIPKSREYAEKMIKILRKVSEKFQNSNITVLFLLEKYYSLLHRNDELYEVFVQILKIYPQDLEYLNKALTLLCISGDMKKAYEMVLSRIQDKTFSDPRMSECRTMTNHVLLILRTVNDRENLFLFAEGLFRSGCYEDDIVNVMVDHYRYWFEIDRIRELFQTMRSNQAEVNASLKDEQEAFLTRISRKKIVVSSCLIGLETNYQGHSNASGRLLENLVRNGLCYYVCPEIFGGLTTPRVPAEILGGTGREVLLKSAKVINQDGEDVTGQFTRGAYMALEFAKRFGAVGAVLQARSPSCGVNSIYDGTFSKALIQGKGVFAELLSENDFTLIPFTGPESEDAVRDFLMSD